MNGIFFIIFPVLSAPLLQPFCVLSILFLSQHFTMKNKSSDMFSALENSETTKTQGFPL